MDDRTPEEIAKGLRPYSRGVILRLEENPLTIHEACPTRNVLPRLRGLVRWDGNIRVTPSRYILTDLGRAVAAILRGEKADG